MDQYVISHAPVFLMDEADPFPILLVGCTVFDTPAMSKTVQGLRIDPAEWGAKRIIEYALYFDYDIQHLYDLEHAWVLLDETDHLMGCWSSYHGLRMNSSGLPNLYRTENGRPVLYLEPGKHALLPDPSLFGLHVDYPACCNRHCGGGLLIPSFLRDQLHSTPEQDEKIRAYMRKTFSFTPSEVYHPVVLAPEQFVSADTLLARIPALVRARQQIILGE